jgi:hypothetical protein
MFSVPRRIASAALLLLLLWTPAACGTSRPIGPTPIEVTDTILLFSNTLELGGSAFFSFIIDARRSVSVTFASTMASVTGPATPTPLGLGVGIPSGTDCTLSNPAMVVPPGLTEQITVELDAGTYCVRIADAGAMSGPLTFAIRLRIALGRPALPAPGTDLFATSLAVQGATSRSVQASQAGVVQLTLQGLGAGASQLGVGIGIPRADGSGCFLTQSLFTPPGASPQIAISVAAGQYCVRVFDPGTITNPVNFILKIDFP